jgi:hypothetical protein
VEKGSNDVIEMGGPSFRVVLDEMLGGEITHVGPDGGNVLAHYGWASPVSHRRSSSYDAGGPLDWLSEYRGGWQALLPNAGDPCTVDGIPLPFHGEWSRTQLDVLRRDENSVTFQTGTRLPLLAQRTVRIRPGAVRVSTTLVNQSSAPVPFVWGEHPAFAFDVGAQLFVPATRVEVDASPPGPLADLVPGSSSQWPIAMTASGTVDLSTVPEYPTERFCYLVDMPQPWAVAVDGPLAVGLSWDQAAYPHLWFWQERGGPGFPWFGRSSITAIEPAAHWPSSGGLQGAIDRGQALVLAPGQSASSWFCVSVSKWSGSNPIGVDSSGNVSYEGGQ